MGYELCLDLFRKCKKVSVSNLEPMGVNAFRKDNAGFNSQNPRVKEMKLVTFSNKIDSARNKMTLVVQN